MSDAEVGRFRRADETVTVQDVGTGDVLHVPPDTAALPARLEALCAFANDTSDDAFLHPVVRAIALHFALAYEHPFVDGNGRTARALFYWSMLRSQYGLTEFLSISRIIQRAPAQYSRAFLHVETDSGDLTYFVVHQLEVLRRAVDELREYLRIKGEEVREADQLLRAGAELNLRQRALLAHALRHPGRRYTIEWYRNENGVVYQTARTDLLALARAGLLDQAKAGRAFVFDVPQDLRKRLQRGHKRASPKRSRSKR